MASIFEHLYDRHLTIFLDPIGFVLLCLSKLLVLNRLSAFVLLNSRLQADRYRIVERVNLFTTALVVLGGLVSSVSGWISAYRSSVVSRHYADAASNSLLFGHNSTVVSANVQSAIAASNAARLAASIQLFTETATLIIIIILFIFSGIIAFVLMRRASSLLENSDTSAPIIASANKAGAVIMRRIWMTVIGVFIGFLFRSSFDVLYSVSLTSDRSHVCAQICDPCQSTLYLISKFLDLSPYIQTSVVFISEPLSLLVALWGMTTPRMWRIFVSTFPPSSGRELSVSASRL